MYILRKKQDGLFFLFKTLKTSVRCVKLAADYVKGTKGVANGYQVIYVATNEIKKKTFANKKDFVSC